MRARKRTRIGNFSWFSPAPLLASINDIIAKGVDDVINAHRQGWVNRLRAGSGEEVENDLCVGVRSRVPGASKRPVRDLAEPTFLIVGDTGEQDASQYAVVRPLLSVCGDGAASGSDFLIIASDVIYPAGDVNDYIDGFYLPFEQYKPPILAIPGNHDWYDGLNGFMYHFCGRQPLPPTSYRAGSYTFQERMARRLWRKAARPDYPELLRYRSRRHSESTEPWRPDQPAPYFAVETEQLLVVCIDTGITGKLDREQGDWLRRVSRDPRSKILVTGKPIYVNNEYHPGPIVWGDPSHGDLATETEGHRTVDDVVRNPKHRYVAVIGGDIHNYQRYSVTVRDQAEGETSPPRRIEYITSGGGGAYLSATHTIKRIDLHGWSKPDGLPETVDPVSEEDFRCYPLRGDSLARFTRRSMPVIYALVVVAIASLIAGAVALGVWGNDAQNGLPRDPELKDVLFVAAVSIVFIPLAMGLGWLFRRLCRLIGLSPPRGFKTFFAVTTTAAIGALAVAAVDAHWDDDWHWIWQVVAMANGLLLVPVTLMLIAYVTRDIGPTFTRTLVLALVPLAVIWRWIDEEPGPGAASIALWVAAGLGALVLLVLGLNWITRKKRGLITFLWCLLPVLALAYVLDATHVLDWSDLGRVAAGIWLLVTALFLIWWCRALAAMILFCRPTKDLDPDSAVRYVAKRLGTEVERPGAANAKLGLRQRLLASVLFSTPGVGKFISEAAEATRPPFFKNFLKLEVRESRLRIAAYGVTGFLDRENDPSIEDCVEIPL